MAIETPKTRIAQLRTSIERHNYRYYVLDAPEIGDREFDLLLKELESLEDSHPEYRSSDSPTQKVGGEPIEHFESVEHGVPMQSIDNTYNEAELRDFDQRVRKILGDEQSPRYIVELKIDGVAISVTYRGGQLQLGATRGDGLRGDDVTHNARTIRDLPLRLLGEDIPEELDVRGEVYIANSDLAAMNEELASRGDRLFANPRNATSGALKLRDPKVCADRRLRFFAHGIGRASGLKLNSHVAFLEKVRDLGMPTVLHSNVYDSIDEVLDECHRWTELTHELDFEIDGMVVKVDSFQQRQLLGSTSKFPRWAIAYKLEKWEAESRVLDIRINVGKTGALTPVADLEPTQIAGTTVQHVSLHNIDEIERKDIRIGDWIIVEKAGKIIPHVVRVLKERRENDVKEFEFPTECPVCHHPAIRDEGGAYIRCINVNCPAQLKEKLLFFAHRDAMDIEGLGEKVIEQLVDADLVDSIQSLYILTSEQFQELDRMGKKSADKLVAGLEESKRRDLSRLLSGLTIRHVGQRTAELLAQHFGSMDKLRQADREELEGIDEIGPIVAESVEQFFIDESNQIMIGELQAAGLNMVSALAGRASSTTGKFAGLSFVVTGTMVGYSRKEMQDLIKANGGKASSSVSKKTDYVVAGDAAGSKLTKAESLGVKVLTEEEFKTLLAE